MSEDNYYVTHIIIPNLPKEGLDQLYYYTTKDKTLNDGKFYWGRGNNAFDKSFIDNLLNRKEIRKINSSKYPLLIKEDETLWISRKGNIYKSGSFLPFIFKKKVGKLEIQIKK
ncbi:MAG: hypothetical protein ACP5NZ_03800 [Nanobdellota archaeon]